MGLTVPKPMSCIRIDFDEGSPPLYEQLGVSIMQASRWEDLRDAITLLSDHGLISALDGQAAQRRLGILIKSDMKEIAAPAAQE